MAGAVLPDVDVVTLLDTVGDTLIGGTALLPIMQIGGMALLLIMQWCHAHEGRTLLTVQAWFSCTPDLLL